VAVIGGGSAGYAAARCAAAAGAKTVLVEGARKMGGLCILGGCMPTKTFLESARRWREIGEAREFGLRVKPGAKGPDLRAIVARKEALVACFLGYRKEQLEKGKFELLRGRARFAGPNRLEVVSGSRSRFIEAKTVILATGSEIRPLPLPGLAETGFLTSDSALDHTVLPPSIVILGGGAIAVEFAEFYSSLGTRVMIIQRSPHLVKEYDEEVSVELEKIFRRRGVKVITGTHLERVGRRGRAKEVFYTRNGKTESVAAAEILYALGRKPRLRTLNLEEAGITLQDGRLPMDASLRAGAPYLFAAGDVAGPHEIVHLAILQGEMAARNALAFLREGGKAKLEKFDYRLRLEVTFTDPEIASLGLTAREAKAQGMAVVTASYRFDDHGKSMIMGANDGFVKLVARTDGPRRGEIVGAQVIGPHASDLIHQMVPMLHFRGTAADLAAMPYYHPTLAEIWSYPAEEIAELLKK
jgi:pyruvate/2-oxoglutarate dehydrogenase complex dihydrolipoamide dehydrogenase (E3) component